MTRWFRLSVREMLLATAVVACLFSMWAPRREEFAVRQTRRDLDVAIMGEGYFSLTGGESGNFHYTRRGRFVVNDDQCVILDTGATRHEDQWFLSPAICIPEEATDVRISTTGLVEGWIPQTKKWDALGMILISRFPNPAGLRKIAPGIFEFAPAAGTVTDMELKAAYGDVIKQGWLDASEPSSTSAALPRSLYFVIAILGGLVLWTLTGARRTAPDKPWGA